MTFLLPFVAKIAVFDCSLVHKKLVILTLTPRNGGNSIRAANPETLLASWQD
jgi:hypothetical protein